MEQKRNIQVVAEYDVAVIGGGIAGVAAAVAAVRCGASVCLVEKGYSLGGLATLGLVIAYLPLCDGMGNQVSTGIAEELLLLSTYDGTANVPRCWQHNGDKTERAKYRYFLEYNAASYILELEKYVVSSGVNIFYDMRAVGTSKQNSKLTAVIVESKSGREAIRCKAVVDATGDADICYFSGEKTVSLNTNSASGWYYSSGDMGNKLHKLFKPFDPCGKILPDGTDKGYSGDCSQQITSHILESRDMIREHIKKMRSDNTGTSVYPFLIPAFPGYRMTRRLQSDIEMDAEDRYEHYDSIGLISNWRKPGPIYSIPFRAIRGVKFENLFVAGRCISSKDNGWDMTRVIPACAVTGEAGGVSAALYSSGITDYREVQRKLIENKVNIRLKQIEWIDRR